MPTFELVGDDLTAHMLETLSVQDQMLMSRQLRILNKRLRALFKVRTGINA